MATEIIQLYYTMLRSPSFNSTCLIQCISYTVVNCIYKYYTMLLSPSFNSTYKIIQCCKKVPTLHQYSTRLIWRMSAWLPPIPLLPLYWLPLSLFCPFIDCPLSLYCPFIDCLSLSLYCPFIDCLFATFCSLQHYEHYLFIMRSIFWHLLLDSHW